MRRNAEMTVDRGEDVVGSGRSLCRVFALGIGCANHLTCSQTTAGEEHGIRLGPMVSPNTVGILAQARRPAKFAHDDDHDSLIKIAVINIVDQCGKTLIQIREASRHEIAEVTWSAGVLNVVVPIRPLGPDKWRIHEHRYDADSCFGEASCQQRGLSPAVHSVR